jgi:hypothetical protein
MDDQDDELARLARELDALAEAERRDQERRQDERRREDEARDQRVAVESAALRAAIEAHAPRADAWLEGWRSGSRYRELERLQRGRGVRVPVLRTGEGAPAFEHERPELRERRGGSGWDIDVSGRVTFTRRAWTGGFGGQSLRVLAVDALAELTRPALADLVPHPERRLELLAVGARFAELVATGRLEEVLLVDLRRRVEEARERAGRREAPTGSQALSTPRCTPARGGSRRAGSGGGR